MWINPLLITTVLGAIGALTAVLFVVLVNRYPKGPEQFVAVWSAIREGSAAYLKRQYRTIYVIAAFIFLLIVGSFAAFPALGGLRYGLAVGGSFLIGVTFSLIAATIAMDSATRANVRTTYAAYKGSVSALRVATLGGAALGLAVIAMSLLGLSTLDWAFSDPTMIACLTTAPASQPSWVPSIASLSRSVVGAVLRESLQKGARKAGAVGVQEPPRQRPAEGVATAALRWRLLQPGAIPQDERASLIMQPLEVAHATALFERRAMVVEPARAARAHALSPRARSCCLAARRLPL